MVRPRTRELSALVGAVYDCALDSTLWPATIAAIGDATDCFAGVIAVADLEKSQIRLMQTWGYEPGVLARACQYAEEIAGFWKHVPRLPALDEPFSSRQVLPHDVYENSRFYNEWGRPQGIIDSLHVTLLRDPSRVGEFSLSRHQRYGFIGDREFEILRLLAPHIRRAVTISDLIDMKNLETQALSATLDSVMAGILVVDSSGRILHANAAAQQMLEESSPIVASDGVLNALLPHATEELMQAIALTQSDEARIGQVGIGVPLIGKGNTPALAHILPLANGDLRPQLMPRAAAAVFVAPAGRSMPRDLDAVARLFGLTPAEAKQLHQLVIGASLRETAIALSVSEATVSSHRQSIFTKMEAAGQAEVMALVSSLLPPAAGPPSDR